MSKERIFKEFKTEKKALNDYDDYIVTPIDVKECEKDYTNKKIGKYTALYPVLLDGYLGARKKGWMCIDNESKYYQILLNSNLERMYLDEYSDNNYFGMEYVSNELQDSRFTIENFKKEFLEECNKIKETQDFFIELKNKLLFGYEKYIKNVENNINYFNSLDINDFNEELNRIVYKYHFIEVKDISSYKNCLYILVLDNYKQFYIGKCVGGLKSRTRKHWTAKIIPNRQIWGGFDYSRMKIDNFKMFDTTRIFVCNDIDLVNQENKEEYLNKCLEKTNTFGLDLYSEMTDLDKAERIVINNSKCEFSLSDRTPILLDPIYSVLEEEYHIEKKDLQIKHYLRIDKYLPYNEENN